MSVLSGFPALLDGLAFAPGRNARLKLIADWLRTTPDPDRGWGLAAMTGALDLPAVKPALLRQLIEERVDPMLFALSYDYVGDLAETVSLLWTGTGEARDMRLADLVEQLQAMTRATAPAALAGLLDRLDPAARYALLKLVTGNLRVGAGARLVRTGFAQAFGSDVGEVEELWHSVSPPFRELFQWAEGKGPRPDSAGQPVFRPFMLAHPLDAPQRIDLAGHQVEWKWDGIRVMAVVTDGARRLYSRDGNDISMTFPDLMPALTQDMVLDGELLVRGENGGVGSFNALQQRLNRKTVTRAMLSEAPVFLRAYDLLFDGGDDVRGEPLHHRRVRLERLVAELDPSRVDLSPLVPADDIATLDRLRGSPPDPAIEGLMLKRRDSVYMAGRVTGLWWKWKRDPLTADCVLMYAQRGHGKRSSFYSDFTFGAWSADGQLLPVGKAYFGFTDAELKWLDKWVREHCVGRFGPVREVVKTLVLEVAFDSIHESTRHKSGLAMRFPRISRIRHDKPAGEADRVETLAALTLAGERNQPHDAT